MKESVTLDINIEKGSGLIQKCEALIPPRLQANPAKREMIIFQFRGLGGGGRRVQKYCLSFYPILIVGFGG